jgi:hypothetical protein
MQWDILLIPLTPRFAHVQWDLLIALMSCHQPMLVVPLCYRGLPLLDLPQAVRSYAVSSFGNEMLRFTLGFLLAYTPSSG